MTDEFVSRFGQLDLGPTHPNNPNDPALSLYDVSNLARRYDFDHSKPLLTPKCRSIRPAVTVVNFS